MKKLIFSLFILSSILFLCGFGFAGQTEGAAGFWLGFWHGLLAPYTLLLRLFMEIHMYAIPNVGWWYDFGFLLGVALSIPVGWIAALVALIYFFGDLGLTSLLGNFKL